MWYNLLFLKHKGAIMDVIISKMAYLRKSDLTQDQIDFLKYQLTIYPRQFRPDDREEPKKLELFQETPNSFAIPRDYFLKRKKDHHKITYQLQDGDASVFKKWPITFKGELRDIQKPIFNSVIQQASNAELGGIICLGTGTGKSVLTLKLVTEFKKPTLVIVNKEFLMDQWIDYTKQFVPNARFGIVQQDQCDFKDKHIVFAMIHSLANRDYGKDFYNHFGIVVADEAHHLGSEQWNPVIAKFPARLRYALSAKIDRADGAENAFIYHIGPIIASYHGTMVKPNIRRVWTNFHLTATEKFNPELMGEATVMKFLCANTTRNLQIIDQTIQAHKAGRKILVLSGRVKHLHLLAKMFENQWVKTERTPAPSYGFFTGGLEKNVLEKSSNADIMFGTYQMIAEAFNRPELDTLVLATPVSNILQAAGRILREHPTKKAPVIVDFRDDLVNMFKSKGEKRDEIYAELMK